MLTLPDHEASVQSETPDPYRDVEQPYRDEPPVLEDAAYPSIEDELWWLQVKLAEREMTLGIWLAECDPGDMEARYDARPPYEVDLN